ncbi:hypothetical protein FEDK69T_07570 [Flavobacterium enshiense DK69]|nr:hypothetical protein FEDK69T_07570 [Flavobacterium enshiense DK69]
MSTIIAFTLDAMSDIIFDFKFKLLAKIKNFILKQRFTEKM